MTDETCCFCGHDPYHYVDIGVGMERAAVNCCDLGIELRSSNPRPEVQSMAERLYGLEASRDLINALLEETRFAAEALQSGPNP